MPELQEQEKEKLKDGSKMAFIAKNVCTGSGHKIVSLDGVAMCSQCGATLAEIRGEK